LRRIPGVKDARQYTIPRQEAVDAVRSGKAPRINAREAHIRDCYVVAEPGADREKIETAIRTMPHYFAGYETRVSFISEEELRANHSGMPHGGFVFGTGETSPGVRHVLEFALKLDSNPEFTASVLVAYARATFRMAEHGGKGALTVFDIPVGWLSPKPAEVLRKELL
jgi:diaminopimelate dehydrogenase